MFFVFNKSKIYSYLVSVGTVVILFVMAFYITNTREDSMQTSSNSNENFINILENNNDVKIKNTINNT